MTNESCSVIDILGKQILDAINALRKDEKKSTYGKIIHSHITQQNATNLDESSVFSVIKLLLEKNLLKNTLTKGTELYYIVSEVSNTAIISDSNDSESYLPFHMRKYKNYGKRPHKMQRNMKVKKR